MYNDVQILVQVNKVPVLFCSIYMYKQMLQYYKYRISSKLFDTALFVNVPLIFDIESNFI